MAFKPGQSGNPNGRPSIAKALAANDTSATNVTAEVIGQLLRGLRELDPGDRFEGASWRFCADKLLGYTVGKPKEIVEFQQQPLITDEQRAAELRAIAEEQLRALTPEQRYQMLADLENGEVQ